MTPQRAPELVAAARAARAAGSLEDSLALFRAALALAPAQAGLRLEVAADLRALDRHAEAAAEYRTVLSLTPGHAGALVGLGHCARAKGDGAAALAAFQAACEARPNHVGAHLAAAGEFSRCGRAREAEQAYRTVLDMAPRHVGALLGLAWCARKRGDLAASAKLNGLVVADEPGHLAAHLQMAADLRDLGDAEGARHAVLAALAAHPGSVPALLSLGRTERQAGRHAAALDAFTQAQAASPDTIEALLEMAQQERTLGRQAACDALFARALELQPGHPGAAVQTAEQARLANDIPRMHALYKDALARQPGQRSLVLGYAEALSLLGRTDEALTHLASVNRSAGDGLAMDIKRASLLRRVGNWPEALALARKVTRDAHEDFSAWMERLLGEAALGTDAEVDACLSRIPARSVPERARLARAHGRIHEDRAETDAALACYEAAEALEPENPETHFLATRLALSTLDLPRARTALRAFMRASAVTTRLRGRSLNPSQTHYGQVLDEFTLDGVTVDKLLAAWAMAPPGRIPTILRIVAENPDSTAAGITLVHALRAARFLDRCVARPGDIGNDAIPRSIAQFWDTQAVPDDVAGMMRSWAVQNPGFEVCRFDDPAARAFLARHHGRAAAELYGRAQGAAQKADLFRLGWLLTQGGIYVDADDRCHAPIGAVLPPGADIVLYQEDFGTIGNNFVAASPGHPVIARAFMLALESLARGDEDTVWLSTGPGLLTRAMAQVLAEAGADWPTAFPAMAILTRRRLFGAVAIHCQTGYKATPRHWGSAGPARAGRAAAPG